MDKVLLVSVIALAVALLSMLVNLALVWKISDLKNKLECRVEEADIRKHKPDRRRKDNYYRKPNKSNVIIDEFASDIIE